MRELNPTGDVLLPQLLFRELERASVGGEEGRASARRISEMASMGGVLL